ncbi:MAG: DUF3500 domain-containing protein [Betaproteobacteria bacterium]|nr:DUF3500 domain-containing protein [Betaproteobacteria bacterium]
MPDTSKLIMIGHASAVKPTPVTEFPERLQGVVSNAMARAKAALADQFKGTTTDGTTIPGLFPLSKTGISVQPVIDAAVVFAASLSDAQRKDVFFPVESDAWRSWHNMHIFLFRHGVCLIDMPEPQRQAALALVRATSSAAGFASARNVMKLNEHVSELTGRTEEYGEWYYWMSVFGTPSSDEPWGWQIDGHHLSINCFVLGDQIVLTPDFQGSEPVHAHSGKYAGTQVFQDEEAKGFRLMQSLTPEQQARATIGTTIPREVITIAQVDNAVLPYAGIPYTALTSHQQALMLEVIALYTNRIRPGHAEIRLDEVKAHLGETYFGWIGACEEESPFYYRIHSPVILIEFDHLPGIVWDNKEPTRRHIHTVVRTPNGNDYGRDLLRQHYEEHDHVHPHSPHRRGHE